MKYSLNGDQPCLTFIHINSHMSNLGLISHLKTHFSTMHRLYLILKDQTDPPTNEELAIASGQKVLDLEAANAYLGSVEKALASLLSMFAKQAQENAVSVSNVL